MLDKKTIIENNVIITRDQEFDDEESQISLAGIMWIYIIIKWYYGTYTNEFAHWVSRTKGGWVVAFFLIAISNS